MKIKKNLLSVLLILILTVSLVGCNKESEGKESGTETAENTVTVTTESGTVTESDETATETAEPSETAETPVKVEYNPAEDRMDNLTLSNPELDTYTYETETKEEEFDSDYSLTVEMESGSVTGAAKVVDLNGASGGKVIDIAGNAPEDTASVTVSVPASGTYTITVGCAFPYGEKANNILIDGDTVGEIHDTETSAEVREMTLEGVYISGGEHTLSTSCSWGWWQIDYVRIDAEEAGSMNDSVTKSAELSDPYATLEAKMLYQFIQDIDGKYTLSGQVGDYGMASNELTSIYETTGRYPAILGLDMMSYSPVRAANGEKSVTVQKAIDYSRNQGGIVTICWHWTLDEKYDKEGAEYWRGFYSEYLDLDKLNLTAIMNGEDEEGMETLLTDIDSIAFFLKQLQEENVPVLWRPLHEASGGWFWWGAYGSETYIKLWKLLYDRLVNYHGLHNLIWVWNGQDADWYPGDEYCDVISTDIYPGEKVYSSQASKYMELAKCTDSYKPIALSENGCLFDPDLALRDNSMWTWFCTWGGEFATKNGSLNEQYTEASMWKKVYNHTSVITLDELPDLTSYGLQ